MSAQGSADIEKPPKRVRTDDDGLRARSNGRRPKRRGEKDPLFAEISSVYEVLPLTVIPESKQSEPVVEIEHLNDAAPEETEMTGPQISISPEETRNPEPARSERPGLSKAVIDAAFEKIDRAERTVVVWGKRREKGVSKKENRDKMLRILSEKRALIETLLRDTNLKGRHISEKIQEIISDIPDIPQIVDSSGKTRETLGILNSITLELMKIPDGNNNSADAADRNASKQGSDGTAVVVPTSIDEAEGSDKVKDSDKKNEASAEEGRLKKVKTALFKMRREFMERIKQQRDARREIARPLPEGGYFTLDMCGVSLEGLSSDAEREAREYFESINEQINGAVNEAIKIRDQAITLEIKQRIDEVRETLEKLRKGEIRKDNLELPGFPDISVDALRKLGLELLPKAQMEYLIDVSEDLWAEVESEMESIRNRDNWIEPVLEWNDKGGNNSKDVTASQENITDKSESVEGGEEFPRRNFIDVEPLDEVLSMEDVQRKSKDRSRQLNDLSEELASITREISENQEQLRLILSALEETKKVLDKKAAEISKLELRSSLLFVFAPKSKKEILLKLEEERRFYQENYEENISRKEDVQRKIDELEARRAIAEGEMDSLAHTVEGEIISKEFEESKDSISIHEEDRAPSFKDLLSDIDSARKAYAEAWATKSEKKPLLGRKYEEALQAYKKAKLEWVKEQNIKEDERFGRVREVSMFFYDEALRLYEAQTEAKREHAKGFKLAFARADEFLDWFGGKWNALPRSTKLIIASAGVGLTATLTAHAFMVPAAGLALARKLASGVGTSAALHSVLSGREESSRKKVWKEEKSGREKKITERLEYDANAYPDPNVKEAVAGIGLALDMGRVFDDDIKELDARVAKLRRKRMLNKYGSRMAAFGLGAALSWAAESLAGTDPSHAVDTGKASVAVTSSETYSDSPVAPRDPMAQNVAYQVPAPEPMPAPPVGQAADTVSNPAPVQASEPLTYVEDASTRPVASIAETSAAVDTPISTFSERLADHGHSLVVETGGSVEGTISKQLELSGMSHEEAGKKAHRMLVEYAGKAGKPLNLFDKIPAGREITFDSSSVGKDGIPKIASIEWELSRQPILSGRDLVFASDINSPASYDAIVPMSPDGPIAESMGAASISADSGQGIPVQEPVQGPGLPDTGARANMGIDPVSVRSAEFVEKVYASLDPISRVEFDMTREAFLKEIFDERGSLGVDGISGKNVEEIFSSKALDPKIVENLSAFRDAAGEAFPQNKPFSLDPIGHPYPKETVERYVDRITALLLDASNHGKHLSLAKFGGFRGI